MPLRRYPRFDSTSCYYRKRHRKEFEWATVFEWVTVVDCSTPSENVSPYSLFPSWETLLDASNLQETRLSNFSFQAVSLIALKISVQEYFFLDVTRACTLSLSLSLENPFYHLRLHLSEESTFCAVGMSEILL